MTDAGDTSRANGGARSKFGARASFAKWVGFGIGGAIVTALVAIWLVTSSDTPERITVGQPLESPTGKLAARYLAMLIEDVFPEAQSLIYVGNSSYVWIRRTVRYLEPALPEGSVLHQWPTPETDWDNVRKAPDGGVFQAQLNYVRSCLNSSKQYDLVILRTNSFRPDLLPVLSELATCSGTRFMLIYGSASRFETGRSSINSALDRGWLSACILPKRNPPANAYLLKLKPIGVLTSNREIIRRYEATHEVLRGNTK